MKSIITGAKIMGDILQFVRTVDLEVAECGNCDSNDYLLANNGEIYCSECRQFAPNIRWHEQEIIND